MSDHYSGGGSDDGESFSPGKLLLASHTEESIPEEGFPAEETDGPLGRGSEYLGKPEGITWGDFLLVAGKPLRHSHEVLCFMAAAGSSNTDIATSLGLSPGRVSILLSNTRIRRRIKDIQEAHWGSNIQARFQSTIPKAMDVITNILTGDDPTAKVKEKLQAATWLLEKTTGKARQEFDAEAGANTVLQLIQALELLKTQQAETTRQADEGGPIIDVTPKPAPDPLDQWVTQHVPELKQEKS